MPDIVLDFQRSERTGLEEAVLCAGKSPEQIQTILAMAREQSARLLLTRLQPDLFAALSEADRADLDYDVLSGTAFLGALPEISDATNVCAVTGGSSDARVALEAIRTLQYYGHDCAHFADLGVAGLWRLTDRLEEIGRFPVVLVVAGMEAAMPTVLGGLIRSAIIAVPTSAGYGLSEGGRTALNAALTSCSPGLCAVNIDNGYGAACVALRILNAAGLIGRSR
ncbi:MAG: nickel pincer cofactor biosynthesis protein LarB [Methyloligellaceae bacterium]